MEYESVIDLPAWAPEYATDWHDGQSSMLYAIASTGVLARGSIRPSWDGEPLTDEEWAVSLVADLWSELRSNRRMLTERFDEFDDAEVDLERTKILMAICDEILEADEFI